MYDTQPSSPCFLTLFLPLFSFSSICWWRETRSGTTTIHIPHTITPSHCSHLHTLPHTPFTPSLHSHHPHIPPQTIIHTHPHTTTTHPHTSPHTHPHTCSCHQCSLSCSITRRSSCSSLFWASSDSILLRYRVRVAFQRDSLFSRSSLTLDNWREREQASRV